MLYFILIDNITFHQNILTTEQTNINVDTKDKTAATLEG